MLGPQLLWFFSAVAGNLLSGHFAPQQSEFFDQSSSSHPLIFQPANSELSTSLSFNPNQNQEDHRSIFHSYNIQSPLIQYHQFQTDSSHFNPNQVTATATASAYASHVAQFAQQFVAQQAAKASLINTKIDQQNLAKYNQYLDILQKTYGIQLPGELGRKPDSVSIYQQSSYPYTPETSYQNGAISYRNYAGLVKQPGQVQQVDSVVQHAKNGFQPMMQPQVYQSKMPFAGSQANYVSYPGVQIQSQTYVEQPSQQYTQSMPSAYIQQTLNPQGPILSNANTARLQPVYSTIAPQTPSEFSPPGLIQQPQPQNIYSNSDLQQSHKKIGQFLPNKMENQLAYSIATKQQVPQSSPKTAAQDGHNSKPQIYTFQGSHQPDYTTTHSIQLPAPYDPSIQRYDLGYGSEASLNSVKDSESSGSVIGGIEQKPQPNTESEFDSYDGYRSPVKIVVPPRPITQYSTPQPTLRTTRPTKPTTPTYTYSTAPTQSYVHINNMRPAENARTTLKSLTQQIRRLPAVLYLDSHSESAKQMENLLRDTYGLPLVSFYVDKIEQTEVVQKHLQQLTAHNGMPYFFICGTFIGSEQHIENYHKNKQIPQLVEYVCGDEKKKKTNKTTA